MGFGDFNGHMVWYIDWVHGGHVVGQRNLEGRMLLVFYLVKELCMSNAWFKRKEKRKMTFRLGTNET